MGTKKGIPTSDVALLGHWFLRVLLNCLLQKKRCQIAHGASLSDAHFAKVLIDRLGDRNGDPLGFSGGAATIEFACKVSVWHGRYSSFTGCERILRNTEVLMPRRIYLVPTKMLNLHRTRQRG